MTAATVAPRMSRLALTDQSRRLRRIDIALPNPERTDRRVQIAWLDPW
jgi:hypothetical protein